MRNDNHQLHERKKKQMEEWLEQVTEEEAEKYCLVALKGDPEAQYRLGRCYYDGKGVEQDMEDAVVWLRKAANQRHAEAMYWLAECYLLGCGFENEDEANEAAIKWFETAAKQDHAEAMFRLGECYENGEGVEADFDEAIGWYESAAEQGHAEAQNRFGTYYLEEADEEDPKEAFKWFWRSAKQGNANGQYSLGEWFKEVDKEEAKKWFRMAADQGNTSAKLELGETPDYSWIPFIKSKVDHMPPPCPKCPYQLGQIRTPLYPCSQCKTDNYSAYDRFRKIMDRSEDPRP